jgi:putative intracellular protease/amidase
MRILMLLIPDDQHSPLLDIGQVVEPYYLFRDSGAEVVFASPDGGAPVSIAASHDRTSAVLRLRGDHQAREALADTLSLDQVSTDDFQAAFCIGTARQINGGDHLVSLLVAQLLGAGKPVAMLTESRGVRMMITGDAPGPTAQALLSALRAIQQ